MAVFPVVDRSRCARPVVREKRIAVCGAPATVVALPGSGWSWAYCLAHATAEARLLRIELETESAVADRVWRNTKLLALLDAIEVAPGEGEATAAEAHEPFAPEGIHP